MQSSFGATRVGKARGMRASCSPVARVRCTHCAPESPAEYLIWGDRGATDAEREEAVVLFARLIREGHPDHRTLAYGASTLEELSEQLWHKLANSLIGDFAAHREASPRDALHTL